jgi:hypothetical protein
MKRAILIAWAVGQAFYLFALFELLSLGVEAQRTHNYSVLRELEIKGLLVTNTADLIKPGYPGHGFVAMEPLRTFQTLSLALSGAWTLISAVLLVAWMYVSQRGTRNSDTLGHRRQALPSREPEPPLDA